MAVVYLYILGASQSPDRVECVVPWKVDEAEIFFGPCKAPLREKLRKELLRDRDHVVPEDDIYFVGANALGPSGVRKIVWAGRMLEAMSFARAARTLTGPRFAKLHQEDWPTPLHVRPLDGSDKPTGYRHVGTEHLEGDEWHSDLLGRGQEPGLRNGRELSLEAGTTWWDGFRRDVCFRFENLFFASGKGLEIDSELQEILSAAQQGRSVDARAIFGWSGSRRNGRRGGWLLLKGDNANRMVAWLLKRRPARLKNRADADVQSATTPGRCRR